MRWWAPPFGVVAEVLALRHLGPRSEHLGVSSAEEGVEMRPIS